MRTVAACALNPPALQDVGWVFPNGVMRAGGQGDLPKSVSCEERGSTGINSGCHQYSKPGEETFIRVPGQSSIAERSPGKSVIPHSLYWNLLKSVISIFSRWLHLSFPAAGVLHRVFVDHIFMPCPICCLRTLGPKSKLLFSQGIKCQLTAGIQSSASHCFFQYEYWNLPSCLGWWLMCQHGPDASRAALSHPSAAALQRLHLLLQEGYPEPRLTVLQWVQLLTPSLSVWQLTLDF